MLGNIAEFIRTRIRVGRPPPPNTEAEFLAARARATRARELLGADVFIEAYQDELADIVDAFLALRPDEPATPAQAAALVARSTELQGLARKLAGYVSAYEIEAHRRHLRG